MLFGRNSQQQPAAPAGGGQATQRIPLASGSPGAGYFGGPQG